MEYLSKFQHAGDLEIHYGAELRWVPKKIHFWYEGMRARTQLASMFHNYNVDRRQAKSADGSDQWKVLFPKAKKAWVAKKVYVKRSTDILESLMWSMYECKEDLDACQLPEAIYVLLG